MNTKLSNLRANDRQSMLDTIWSALHCYREDCIPEGRLEYDDDWSDVCTAMAWIEEDLVRIERVKLATEILEDADVMHLFDDKVWVQVDRETLNEFNGIADEENDDARAEDEAQFASYANPPVRSE
jgi:hypothetical protein